MITRNPQTLANEYAKWHAREARAKKQMSIIREQLLPILRKKVPNKGPYLVAIETCPQPLLRWKAYAHKLSRLLYGKKAKTKINSAIKNAGYAELEKLTVKPNPDWESD